MRDESLIPALLAGNRGAISRAISVAERGTADAAALQHAVFGHTGSAHRVGITGPPGSGKSTLINRLVAYFRSCEKSVAVVAIDPSSPNTDGALLGDRIRMTAAVGDSSVYIRSMASRGCGGGLCYASDAAADILDAAGFDYVLIETVGVGQTDLDIANLVDTVMVVLVPESGDSVQAMKAGLMEVGDLFVLNKYDRPGSDRAYAEIRSALDLDRRAPPGWAPDIARVIAVEGRGTAELAERIRNHREYLLSSNELRKRRERRIESRIMKIAEKTVCSELWNAEGRQQLSSSIGPILEGDASPYEVAMSVLNQYREPR